MGYIVKNLIRGEKIVYDEQPHWIVFGTPALLFLLSLFSYVYLGR